MLSDSIIYGKYDFIFVFIINIEAKSHKTLVNIQQLAFNMAKVVFGSR